MEELRKEENKMPLTIDKETIEKHPLFKEGIEKGIKKGKLLPFIKTFPVVFLLKLLIFQQALHR